VVWDGASVKGIKRVHFVLIAGVVAIVAAAAVWVTAFAASPSPSPGAGVSSHSAASLGGHHKSGQPGLKRRDAEAHALGITMAELRADFAKGMTLHQIADTKGISLAQFTTAVLAAEKAQLAAAVQAGTITQAQADQISQRESTAKIAARWDSPDHRAHSGGTPATPSTPATTG
jgi:hypothetical protein